MIYFKYIKMKKILIFALIVLMFEFTIQTSNSRKNCTEGNTLICKTGVHNKTYCICKKDSKIKKCPKGTYLNIKYINKKPNYYCDKKKRHKKFHSERIHCPQVVRYCGINEKPVGPCPCHIRKDYKLGKKKY